jgi:acetyltransferase
LWKGGVTEQGAKAAASHTANLTGSYEFYQAVFKQAGIIEIAEVHEAVDLVKAFEARKFPRGRRVAVMGGSGGSAIVFADAAARSGLTFSTLSEHTRNTLSKVVPDIGAVDNPVDFTAGYIAGGNASNFETAVTAVLDDADVDAVCINFATTAGTACLAGAQVLSAIVENTTKPIFVFLSTPPNETGNGLFVLEEAKIPVLGSPVRVARAIAALAMYREARERVAADSDEPELSAMPVVRPRGTLSEVDSKAVLERAGISITRDTIVRCVDDVRFEALNPPLAVKIVSPDIPHKTQVGGVKLNIYTRSDLERALAEVLDNARSLAPEARIESVMVSEMLGEGFELLAGVVNDAIFGPVVVVGAGGIYAETLRDTACRLAPFGEPTAHDMLNELRCRAVLDGGRGKPALDVDAVARALAALSRLGWHNRDTIAEIDINPLFALPGAAVAADALIVGRHAEPPLVE